MPTGARAPSSARALRTLSAAFFVLGPGLEAGVGPALLTGGWQAGDGLPGQTGWTIAGVLLVASGLAVLLQCFGAFARDGRGTPTPAVPTGQLVVTGAYRHVRNPMYVATAAVIVGQAFVLARPVLLVAAAAYVLTLGLAGRRWEEPALRARFGLAYEAYRRAVPGWWPRLRPWTP
jgi:protein-S-isoprenylcysteine O-methyltransferase Ste14